METKLEELPVGVKKDGIMYEGISSIKVDGQVYNLFDMVEKKQMTLPKDEKIVNAKLNIWIEGAIGREVKEYLEKFVHYTVYDINFANWMIKLPSEQMMIGGNLEIVIRKISTYYITELCSKKSMLLALEWLTKFKTASGCLLDEISTMTLVDMKNPKFRVTFGCGKQDCLLTLHWASRKELYDDFVAYWISNSGDNITIHVGLCCKTENYDTSYETKVNKKKRITSDWMCMREEL